jgi:hypothetical protein
MNLISKVVMILLQVETALALPSSFNKAEKRETTHLFGSSSGVPGNNLFNYVIIGGGNSGLTLAARLAKIYTVAVIEAGSFYELGNGNLSQIPADDARFTGKDPQDTNPLIDWSFQTTPQPVITSLLMFLKFNLIMLTFSRAYSMSQHTMQEERHLVTVLRGIIWRIIVPRKKHTRNGPTM